MSWRDDNRTGHKSERSEKRGGFTGSCGCFVATLCVIIVLLLAAWQTVFVPHTWNNLGGEVSRYQRTRGDLLTISTALTNYAGDDQQALPCLMDGPISRIAPLLEPTYIRKMPTHDGWHRPIRFQSDGTSWEIRSLGRDGRRDPPEGESRVVNQDLTCTQNGEIRSDLLELLQGLPRPD
jgi:hypothetical protein